MSSGIRESEKTRKKFVGSRAKEVILLFVLGLVLLLVAWQVFHGDDQKTSGTDTEAKVCALLQEIHGVGDVNVMICETEDGVQSVVVVCEGANDLQVVINIREAVAAALGTQEKAVKIYLKKE